MVRPRLLVVGVEGSHHLSLRKVGGGVGHLVHEVLLRGRVHGGVRGPVRDLWGRVGGRRVPYRERRSGWLPRGGG